MTTELTWTDIVEIQSLTARYGLCLDNADFAAFGALWTDDGVFRMVNNDGGGVMPDTVVGRPAIVEAFSHLAEFIQGKLRIRHITGNLCLEHSRGEPDEILATSAMVALSHPAGTDEIVVTNFGMYNDRLRRVNGEWRFVERIFSKDPPIGVGS